jgi:elongation factor Ts
MVDASTVKELRERTGAGMMDCKRVLVETDGNIEKAIEVLREKGLAAAAKKAGRIASEGIVEAYIHGGGRIGVLIEVNSETDFVAKNVDFRAFVRDMAMQVAATSPMYVSRDEVDQAVIEKEKEIFRQQAINEGKPEKIIEKMVEGRVEKYYKEICLLEQPFVKNPDMTVQVVLNSMIAKIGENLSIRRFTRYEMGEGLQKKEDNFVEEVMSQMKK